MSCCQQFDPLISGAFRPFLFRESAKSRRSYTLRSTGIFPVLGQVMGQSSRATSEFAPDINKEKFYVTALSFPEGIIQNFMVG